MIERVDSPDLRQRVDTRPWMRPTLGEMEAFRTVMEAVLKPVDGGKTLLFASARPGEGKSTVVQRYADILSHRSNLSVLIVDAGPGHAVAEQHGRSAPALEDLLVEEGEAERGLTAFGKAPAGTVTVAHVDPRRTSFLDATACARLRSLFDFTLVDVPSLSALPSIVSIVPLTDGAILVVEAERTRWPVARYAREELERGGGKVLGVFLNKRQFYIPPAVYRWF